MFGRIVAHNALAMAAGVIGLSLCVDAARAELAASGLTVRRREAGPVVDLTPRELQIAQLLAVMSIDDWYMGSAAPEQLRMAAVWRAVETGLPLVRSASLGYSLAVDARGNVLAEAPLGKRFPLRVELDIPQKADLFPPVNVFPWLAAASCVAAPLAAAFRLRRPKT